MIVPERWADEWLDAWARRDLDAILALYADNVEVRSPFAKVYAQGGSIRGKAALREYWQEIMRRIPNLTLQKIAVYSGHDALALHHRDDHGRNCIMSVVFDDCGNAVLQTGCFDRLR